VANPVVQATGGFLQGTTNNNLTVTLPTTQAGDLAICFGAIRSGSATWTAPSAPWTQLFSQGATSQNLSAWGIICTGSDTAPVLKCGTSGFIAGVITFRPPAGYQWLAVASVLDDLTAYATNSFNDVYFTTADITPTNAAGSGNPFVIVRPMSRNTASAGNATAVATSSGFTNTSADSNNNWLGVFQSQVFNVECRVDQNTGDQPGSTTLGITWSGTPPAESDLHDSVAFTLKTTPSSVPQPIPFSRTQFFIADTIVM